MIPIIIGISSALLQIFFFEYFKTFDKKIIYGLSLAAIGFLYVGFTWTDIQTVLIATIQAIIFLLIAYYGITKSLYIMAAGYFMHGLWDIAYNLWQDANLIPPHYDWFCLSLDFTVGTYLLILKKKTKV